MQFRGLAPWTFERADALAALPPDADDAAAEAVLADLGPPPTDEAERLEAAFVDYLLRGGFPEAAQAGDLLEARRRLRQDILDRSLGRDVLDVLNADPRTLERMFLRICLAPGGLWNESAIARDLQITRPTVARYLNILERAFLVFRLPNLASPIRGQPKVYLVAPALRQALLGFDEDRVRSPAEWGTLAENAVAAMAIGARPDARDIGFWRKGNDECDVVITTGDRAEYIEVKRGGRKALRGIERARAGVGLPGRGIVLTHERILFERLTPDVYRQSAAAWLYRQRGADGGTLRVRLR